MNVGSILRQKIIRNYGPDPRNYYEATPNAREGAPNVVFVTLLLGVEDLHLLTPDGKQIGKTLDIQKTLNRLGWWSEYQIKGALGRLGRRAIDRIREFVAESEEESWKEPESSPIDLINTL